MEFSLLDIKADRTAPEQAFTAKLAIDGKPFMSVVKVPEEHWPDMEYVKGYANAEAKYNAAGAQAQQLGHDHLYALVLALYQSRQKETAEANAKAALDQKIRKLCLDNLVIKLPRHAEGEYWLASEAPKVTITKGKKTTTLAGNVASDAHKEYVRSLFAEVGVNPSEIEFYNDRFQTEQGTLQLAA